MVNNRSMWIRNVNLWEWRIILWWEMNDFGIGNIILFLNIYVGDLFIEKFFKCLVYGVVVVLFVIGNILIIFVFKFNIDGKFCMVNSMFIVSMVVGDFLFIVVSMLERIIRILVNEWWIIYGNWGIFLCKMINYMEKFCMNVLVIYLVMIVIDWFVVVCYFWRRIIIVKRVCFIIVIVWFGLVVYCVFLFYYVNLLVSNENVFCKMWYFFINWWIWYLFFFLLFVLILFVVVGFYVVIIICFWCGERGFRIWMLFWSCINVWINVCVFKMVVMIVFVFYCCILFYWIGWVFCLYYCNDFICSDIYVFVVVFLMYFNSVFNLVIYLFFNYNFCWSFCFILNKLCKCCFINRVFFI